MALQRNQYWWQKGPYHNDPDPHRIYHPAEIQTALGRSNFTDFYLQSPTGSLVPNPEKYPYAYPFGPIFPNPLAFRASTPGEVDLQFVYRPFL